MKKFLILIVSIFAVSCGFTPMYDDANNVSDKTAGIFVKPIVGTNGIEMRNRLRTRLNPLGDPNPATSELTVKLNGPETIYKAIQKTGDASWMELRFTADYTLRDAKTGNVILTGSETASESYTFVQDLIAAQASQTMAETNAVRVLGDRIGTRIQAIMKNK